VAARDERRGTIDGRRWRRRRWASAGVTAMGDGNGGGTIAVGDGNSGGAQWKEDCGVITMRGIENAVDGGGGDGRRRRNGRQDGRASTAGQGDGVSPSSRC